MGQEAVDDKSKEIKAIPRLLDRLELTGALVTIDAMGTQTAIAEAVVRRGADYLLALKANLPATHDGVVAFFADPPAGVAAAAHVTIDADHGRIEERRHLVCHDVYWLFSDRRYPDEPTFPHLAMIAMVESRVERDGRIPSNAATISARPSSMRRLSPPPSRAQWGIENRLHWVLDVVFHDDLARLRSGTGPENMAIVKHMAINVPRAGDDRHSLKVRREGAALNPDYLEGFLRKWAALT